VGPRSHRCVHRFHPGFLDYARHAGFLPRLCRPNRAKTKRKVERFIHCLAPTRRPFSGGEPLGPRRKRLPAFDALQEAERHAGGLSAVRERQTMPGAGEHRDFRLRH
jgi:hypothetical protein